MLLASLATIAGLSPARGQELLGPDEDFQRESILGRALTGSEWIESPQAAAGRVPRLHLFNMPSGFLYEPIGIDTDDGPADDPTQTQTNGSVTGPVQVVLGMDNPFFDYRWRHDAGGFGYYLLDSQVQLLDKGTTSMCLGFQAVTPAGLDAGGLADGPTVFRPAFAWFQEIGSAAALQGFVSKSVRAHAGWTEEFETGFRFGLAFQYGVPWLTTGPNQSVHFFVEALGRYQKEPAVGQTQPPTLELIPGIHWRMSENWWISVGAARRGLVTCSWQF
jgi:hypothetical protein